MVTIRHGEAHSIKKEKILPEKILVILEKIWGKKIPQMLSLFFCVCVRASGRGIRTQRMCQHRHKHLRFLLTTDAHEE